MPYGLASGPTNRIQQQKTVTYMTTQLKPTLGTPHRAIIAGGVIGIAAIYSDGLINLQGMTLTAAMITMSVFGAIVMYIISMLSLFKLRHSEPLLERTFRAPGYPLVPAIALILALVCLTAMVWFNLTIALVFLGFMAVAFAYFQLTAHHRANAPADAMLTGA